MDNGTDNNNAQLGKSIDELIKWRDEQLAAGNTLYNRSVPICGLCPHNPKCPKYKNGNLCEASFEDYDKIKKYYDTTGKYPMWYGDLQ
jgi:hypothetical protein